MLKGFPVVSKNYNSYKEALGNSLSFFDEDEVIISLSDNQNIANFQIETCIDYSYSWNE